MMPITQTKVVIKNSKGDIVQRGNCFAACIASILEVPITEVPNVEVFYHLDNGYHTEVMLTFLNSKGWDLCNDNMLQRFHPDVFGYSFDGTDKNGKISQYYDYKDTYYLASGKSPRDIQHICIYKNGHLVHDPHPCKEGLISLEYFYTLTNNS